MFLGTYTETTEKYMNTARIYTHMRCQTRPELGLVLVHAIGGREGDSWVWRRGERSISAAWERSSARGGSMGCEREPMLTYVGSGTRGRALLTATGCRWDARSPEVCL